MKGGMGRRKERLARDAHHVCLYCIPHLLIASQLVIKLRCSIVITDLTQLLLPIPMNH